MRKDIGLRMISADVIDPRSGRPLATIAFEVSFTSSADIAAKVANELTTLYLNENLNNRTQLARDAATFLETEGDRSAAGSPTSKRNSRNSRTRISRSCRSSANST